MAQVGADPDDLRALARTLRTAAGQLDDLSIGLARRTRSAGWRGPDAEAFELGWQSRHRPALHASSSGLTDLARRAERQAAEQVRASSADSPSTGAGPSRGGSSNAAHPARPVPGGSPSPIPLLGPHPAHGPRVGLPGWPRSEERFAGTVELRVGPVTTAFVGGLTIAELAGGRRRVVLAETLAVGAGAGVGSSAVVGIGGPTGAGATTSGTSADVHARAGLVHRRAWEVDETDLDDLLGRVAFEHAGRAATATNDPLVRLGAAVDHVAGWVTGEDPGWDALAQLTTGVPTPSSTESLTEVQLVGSVGIGLGSLAGPGGRLQGVTSLRVGTAEHRGVGRTDPTRSSVLEVQSSASGELSSTLLRRLGVSLPNNLHSEVLVRLEVPEARSGPLPPHVLVRLSAGDGATTDDVIARVTMGGPDPEHSVNELRRAVDGLGRGDVAGALRQLSQIEPKVAGVEVNAATGTLSGGSARAGMTTGAGIGGGVSVRGSVVHVERG